MVQGALEEKDASGVVKGGASRGGAARRGAGRRDGHQRLLAATNDCRLSRWHVVERAYTDNGGACSQWGVQGDTDPQGMLEGLWKAGAELEAAWSLAHAAVTGQLRGGKHLRGDPHPIAQ